MKYFIALLFCVILASCESITNDRDHSVKFFWKNIISNPTTGAVDSNNQFIEIKDSTFYFWHENIECKATASLSNLYFNLIQY